MIPELNKTYYFFDDGKIFPSRRYEVLITEIIPFDKIDEELLVEWTIAVEKYPWLFNKETDYFIKGNLNTGDEIIELIFVRTKNNGWFSFNDYWWDGRLDIDGTLNKSLEEDEWSLLKINYILL